jgi:hypothetical protein
MKLILILITILIGLGAFGIALGQEELRGKLFIDLAEETAMYSEVHEFGVKTTVTVEKNLCHYCLQNFNPSQCLTMCEISVVD